MLIGVWAVSSAKTNEGWLSEDACRDGVSKPGVPDRLRGREKLNEGRGSEATELMEGDRWYWELAAAGDANPGPEKVLQFDIFLAGWEWKDALRLSSLWDSRGADMMLEERLGNVDLGGANPDSCETCLVSFSGEEGVEAGAPELAKGEGSLGFGSWRGCLPSTTRSVKLSKSPGDCSLRAP